MNAERAPKGPLTTLQCNTNRHRQYSRAHSGPCGERIPCPFDPDCNLKLEPYLPAERLLRRFAVHVVCNACGQSGWEQYEPAA